MISKIRILQIVLTAAIICGCSKDEANIPNDNSISFGTAATWSKGSNIGSIADVDKLNVYSYYIKDKDWKDATLADLQPYFTSDVNTPFELQVADDGSSNYEGGSRYWPAIDGVQLSFYTYYPEGDNFVRSIDNTSGKPTYKYTSSEQVLDNHDLVYSAKCDLTVAKNNNSPQVTFDLKHLLSKLTLRARTINSCSDDATYEEGSVSYTIDGFKISGLYSEGDIEVGVDNNLQLNTSAETIEIETTEGYALKPISNDDGTYNQAAELYKNPNASDVDGYTDVMSEGKAIFVVPQGVGKVARATNPPTIKLRILKRFKIKGVDKLSSIIYETDDIVIPAATNSNNSWEAGKHYGLLFDFDLSKLEDFDTPYTVRSEIYKWTEAVVDVDAHRSIYIYASDNEIDVPKNQDYAQMLFMTNYENDLRAYSRKYELDGTPVEAHGFSYYAVSDANHTEVSGEAIHPVMLWKDGGNFGSGKDYDYSTLIEHPLDADVTDLTPYQDSEGYIYFVVKPDDDKTNNFYYKAMKTTRRDGSMHTNASIEGGANGINKSDYDAVYILELDINEKHLVNVDGSSYNYFYCKIGSEMLSSGGGIITHKFKTTLKKAK